MGYWWRYLLEGTFRCKSQSVAGKLARTLKEDDLKVGTLVLQPLEKPLRRIQDV